VNYWGHNWLYNNLIFRSREWPCLIENKFIIPSGLHYIFDAVILALLAPCELIAKIQLTKLTISQKLITPIMKLPINRVWHTGLGPAPISVDDIQTLVDEPSVIVTVIVILMPSCTFITGVSILTF
jgi:hypothetical protein